MQVLGASGYHKVRRERDPVGDRTFGPCPVGEPEDVSGDGDEESRRNRTHRGATARALESIRKSNTSKSLRKREFTGAILGEGA